MIWIILVLICIKATCGLDAVSVQFSKEYFEYKNVKFVCLLTCGDVLWSQKFAKAVQKSMAVNKVNIEGTDEVSPCLKQSTSTGVMITTECARYRDVLHYASKNMFFDVNHAWLVLDCINNKYINEDNVFNKTESNPGINDANDTCLDVVFEQLNLSIDTDVAIAIREDNQYNVFEVFNYGKIQGGDLIVNKLGNWSADDGLFIINNDYKYVRRFNLQQISLRMIVVGTLPPNIYTTKGNSTSANSTKTSQNVAAALITITSLMILKEAADIHNFKYKYTEVDRWIGNYEQNSPRVVTTSLYFREQDLSPVIRYLPYVFGRFQVLLPPLTSIEVRYFYRIPSYGAGKFENQFLRPLSITAWWCVVAMSGMCAVALLLSSVVERRPSSAQYALFSVMASICQQFFEDNEDSQVRKVSSAGKITIFVTGLSCVLLYNYYTSSVVSWLLNGPPPSINSLWELLDSPLELIYEDIGYTRTWLSMPDYYFNKRNAKVEDALRQKKVFNKKKGAPLLKSVKEGIELVKRGGFAYHTEVSSANKFISQTFTQSDLCELGSLQSMEETKLYAAISRDSPYKEFLTWSLQRLNERGIVKCIQKRTQSLATSCEGSSPRALALGGAAPAFILLAGGYILATFIMILERLKKKLEEKTYGINRMLN